MTKAGKTGYWFLIAVSFVEATLLGLLAFGDYALGKLFHANQVYVWSYWSHLLADILMAFFGLFTTSMILLRNQRAKQIAVFFFSVTIVFVSANVFSVQPPEWWLELSYCALPAAALTYLVSVWRKLDYLQASHKS